jgi:hypothetical protein
MCETAATSRTVPARRRILGALAPARSVLTAFRQLLRHSGRQGRTLIDSFHVESGGRRAAGLGHGSETPASGALMITALRRECRRCDRRVPATLAIRSTIL